MGTQDSSASFKMPLNRIPISAKVTPKVKIIAMILSFEGAGESADFFSGFDTIAARFYCCIFSINGRILPTEVKKNSDAKIRKHPQVMKAMRQSAILSTSAQMR